MVKSWAPGSVLLDKYRVEGELGQGGMGEVVRVTHLQLGEELAIKILSAEIATAPGAHARFLREAQSAVRLRGEHVTRVTDVGVLPTGQPYMVMEYLRGVDLAGALERRTLLPSGEAVDYILQACEALAEAHAAGIVHRDIKPSNLFLTSRPDGSALLKVLDFGVSKHPVGAPLTHSNMVIGTLAYMSPEQMKSSRDVDARADIWALGVVLYECMNGRRPFHGEELPELVLQVAGAPLPAMDPRVPRGLVPVVQRCLERDLSRRFATVADLAAAIAPFAHDERAAGIVVERCQAILRAPGLPAPETKPIGRGPSATTLSGSAGMMRSPYRRGLALGGAAAVAAAMVVGGIVTLIRTRNEWLPASTSTHATSPVDPPPTSSVVLGGSAPPHPVVHEPTPVPSPAKPASGDGSAAAPAPQAAVAPPTPGSAAGVNGDAKAKAAMCADLEVRRDWQRLLDCATELGNLGAHDKAKEFHDKAAKEVANAINDAKARSALRNGNLREAQKLLKTIGRDSVYWANLDEKFRTAENPVIEETRRKAIGMAGAGDCTGLKRLQAQLASSSSTSVAAAANVKCIDSSATDLAKREAPWNDDTPFLPVKPRNVCDTMNVDNEMEQAHVQYTAGFAKAALQVVTKALQCRQDVRMYRMAATYACAAHDLPTAKAYFVRVPSNLQSGIEQKCQQEGFKIRAP